MNKLDLSVIILTFNEEIHIRRCLDRICDIAEDVFVIDCFSTDKSLDIAAEYDNVTVLQHPWPETKYAGQFNWALETAPIKTKWVLRLDADEYLLPETIEELKTKLPTLGDEVTGIVLKRRHIFLGKWMKRGIYPVKLLRLFRYSKAICEQRLMDEHIQLLEGRSVEFDGDFCDHNLNDLSWFCNKHIGYASREAADLLNIEYGLSKDPAANNNIQISGQALEKRKKKIKYARMPLFVRSFFYFLYRYIIRGGFLDGKEGFLWDFLQGWWYRTLVDAKVFEIKKACGLLAIKGGSITEEQKAQVRKHLSENYHIAI